MPEGTEREGGGGRVRDGLCVIFVFVADWKEGCDQAAVGGEGGGGDGLNCCIWRGGGGRWRELCGRTGGRWDVGVIGFDGRRGHF